MNIFEYVDKKRNEYETLRDESQLQLKTNQNRIQMISSQIKHMAEEEEDPGKFFLPETAENYQKEIDELQEKINALELQDDVLAEQIRLCEAELRVLDNLELPDFAKETREPWKPMVVSEEEFQKKNVSRETSSRDASQEKHSENSEQNVSRETFEESATPGSTGVNPDLDLIKEKIQFCRQISQLDPQRCSLALNEILELFQNAQL